MTSRHGASWGSGGRGFKSPLPDQSHLPPTSTWLLPGCRPYVRSWLHFYVMRRTTGGAAQGNGTAKVVHLMTMAPVACATTRRG